MSVMFDASRLQLLHKPPQHWGKVGDLVSRRWVEEVEEEDVSESV